MKHPVRRALKTIGLVGLVVLVSLPAFGTSQSVTVSDQAMSRLSQGALLKAYFTRPDLAPARLGARLRAARDEGRAATVGRAAPSDSPFGDRFNFDVFGLPQNEESVDVCTSNRHYVLSGTNDYRGILNADVNFTGWHWSIDGGRSLSKEGLVPPVDGLASSGDPIMRFDRSCNLYTASLAFNVFDPATEGSNGIGIWSSDPSTLSNCDTSQEPFVTDPGCWPHRRLVATNRPDHFLDKEAMDVGATGDGRHVWVTWSDFNFAPGGSRDFTAEIFAARCEADLSGCTDPIQISGSENDIQFSYPTIGADGRTYITWVAIQGELTGDPQRFRVEMRVAEAGSTTFGPKKVIVDLNDPIGFGNLLHANTFRIATMPKNTVKLVNGHPRVFVTYEDCRVRILDDTVCEEARVWLAWSDDFGDTWQFKIVSQGGDNYFPYIANDSTNGKIVLTYFTSRHDPQFHNRQDVELLTIDATTAGILRRQRVTPGVSNEPEADPIFQAEFIGDYIEVAAHAGTAYVAYNINLHDVAFLGSGVAIPQQDNFLTVMPM